MAVGWWLPTLYAWGAMDAADVAMGTLMVVVALVASAMPPARLITVVIAIVVLVGALTVAWAAADLVEISGRLVGIFERLRGMR